MKPDLIYDIGMHVGQDTVYYLREGFNVLAVEANPMLVEKARKKFAGQIADGKLTILNVGISDSEGVRPFYKNLKSSIRSSFNMDMDTKNSSNIEVLDVVCTTTSKLFEIYGIPYYMKIDIEGSDHLCLNDIPDNGSKPKYVSCEAGSIDYLKILASKGYTKFKMISQGGNFTPINIKKEKQALYPYYQILRNFIKGKLQTILPVKHLVGSAGPFGEKSKGEWKNFGEVYDLYMLHYHSNGNKPLNFQSWFDFHATF